MKHFVSLEQSKQLKKLGFSEPTQYFYSEEELHEHSVDTDEILYGDENPGLIPISELLYSMNECWPEEDSEILDAPEISQAQDWVYKKHGIWIEVSCSGEKEFEVCIKKSGKQVYKSDVKFETPEKALSLGLTKALEELCV